VSPVRYELGFYIPENDILHSHCRGNLKSYMALFPSSGEGCEISTLLSQLQRVNTNHWALALYKEHDKACLTSQLTKVTDPISETLCSRMCL
jgi:hypothetical protein